MYKRLAFRPTWSAVGKALVLWTALLLAATILLVGGLLAFNVLLPGPGWNQPPLDGVSSVLVRSGQDTIRLAGNGLDCGPGVADFRCTSVVDGQPLVVSISQGDQHPVCAATYAGEAVACWASWNNTRFFDYYAVIEDDLGLPAERFAELASQTAGAGWGESDWLRLGRVLAIVVGLVAAGWLWGRTRQRGAGKAALRLIYTGGMSALALGFVWFVSLWTLVALRLID
jgi:hypothetical protein